MKLKDLKDPRRWPLHAAFLCGVAPACASALIFSLWLVTRHPGLVVAGAAALIVDMVSLIVGAVFLMIRVRRERSYGASEADLARERRWGGIVFLANLPIAAMLVVMIFISAESYSVTVENHGLVAVDSFAVVDRERSERVEVGALAPGAERSAALRITGKTTLEYEMVRFGQTSTGTVCGYTEPELAGDQWSVVTIGEDGKVLVEESASKGP